MRMHLRHGSGPISHRVQCWTGNNAPRTPSPMATMATDSAMTTFMRRLHKVWQWAPCPARRALEGMCPSSIPTIPRPRLGLQVRKDPEPAGPPRGDGSGCGSDAGGQERRAARPKEAFSAREIPWEAVRSAGTVNGTAASSRGTMALSAAAMVLSGPKTGTAMPVHSVTPIPGMAT